MNTDKIKTQSIFIKPGELHIAQTPSVISTILGSCVSVTMFNRRLSIGAICHAIMPKREIIERGSRNCHVNYMKCNDKHTSFKYVDCSILYMLGKFTMSGISPGEIEVKMFGGAELISSRSNKNYKSIGRQNIEVAIQTLKDNNLNLHSCDAGGISGCKIYFNTYSGEVFLKYLNHKSVNQSSDDKRIIMSSY